MTGAQAALAALVAEGVTHVFGVAGTSEVPLINHMSGYPELTYMMALHEAVAVGIADGYTRAQPDSLGVALLHASQGTLNGIGYIRAAFRDQIPVVVISGAPGTAYAVNEPNHFLHGLRSMLDSVTKWSWQVSRANEIPWAVHHAVTISRAAPEGPVQLMLPQNCLVEETDAPIAPRVWQQLRQRTQPNPETLREVARLVMDARCPVIYAGGGVASAGATSELVEFAELLAAPVIGEAVDRGPMVQSVNFPGNHALYLGFFSHDAALIMSALRESDLVIVLGVKTTYERVVGDWIHRSRILHIDRSSWEIGKNHPFAMGVVGDLKATLYALNEQLRAEGIGHRSLPEQRRGSSSSSTVCENEPAEAWEGPGLTPVEAVRLMNSVLRKSDVIIVDDSQSLSHYLKWEYCFESPDTLYGSLASHLGWGLPAALGVQLARTDRQVLCLVSDGSLMFAPQALWTAARYEIPVTVMVANNGGFVSLRQELAAARGGGGVDVATVIDAPPIDIVGLGRSLGVDSQTITTADELEQALAEIGRRRGPRLLDVKLAQDVHQWRGSWFVPADRTL
jgi:benzoylformate decarboxylase